MAFILCILLMYVEAKQVLELCVGARDAVDAVLCKVLCK